MSGGTRRGAQLAGGSLSRVLVTGGAGFIGRRVVRALLDEDHQVTSADKHAVADLASTNAVTGDVGQATITEQTPLRPVTPYGASKAEAEMLLAAYAASYGLTGAALRFSNAYGP